MGCDFQGNLTSDGRYAYAWDDENRLVRLAPSGTPQEGDVQMVFYYDALGRRIYREVQVYSTSIQDWEYTSAMYFLYNAWNLVEVFDLLDAEADIKTQYTWGLDLSGSLQGAGGIGGLLAAKEPAGTCSRWRRLREGKTLVVTLFPVHWPGGITCDRVLQSSSSLCSCHSR